mmetsp:Transcript_87554/g.171253  ORF Transcript_87554/g.171253 Transcript_87554/m.171253 type:complete len:371 (-) Transcript_87554:249-1361(-)|eukprot:CAMPEP_0170390016 /NCGR_PEP_ID=MMETSP0117_2-20130122/18919_1 /TAXON_ID=400756 /ORGANISM="Durinskia baltica, Strain CSIRO CS-38" /LENGTH=370 /DNA_ID=CAMNT_0010646029 /DNA_START=58 /DNA_END=1170 /DNA_ORIENTATION=-
MSEVVKCDVVELDYNDLINGVDLSADIEKAYGFDGAGVLTVRNVPEYIDARGRLLPLSKKFADLPNNVKEKYVMADAYYAFGWSHGKEKLQEKPDFSKGSYYNNPQYDRPVDDEDIIAKYPSFVHPNIWPKDELPEMEHAFKELGQIIVSVGKLVAKQADKFVRSKCSTYPEGYLENVINTSKCCKARLLHYFPIAQDGNQAEESKDSEFSSWCGWHNDHGSLTGLTSAMYLDEAGDMVVNTDKDAGLYIRNRKSELLHINIPVTNIAFQIGETAQVHSGGFMQATPHAVRGSKMAGVSRETFAVFMEPNWYDPMEIPAGVDPAHAQSQSAAANLPPGVPPLSKRWEHREAGQPAQTFGEFSDKTHASYY